MFRRVKNLSFAFVLFFLCIVGLISCDQSKNHMTFSSGPPSVDIVQQYISQHGVNKKVKVLGLHETHTGEYMVITDSPASLGGGPFPLYWLKTGKWVISLELGGAFQIIKDY